MATAVHAARLWPRGVEGVTTPDVSNSGWPPWRRAAKANDGIVTPGDKQRGTEIQFGDDKRARSRWQAHRKAQHHQRATLTAIWFCLFRATGHVVGYSHSAAIDNHGWNARSRARAKSANDQTYDRQRRQKPAEGSDKQHIRSKSIIRVRHARPAARLELHDLLMNSAA
ncbi:hypothetical protein [Terrarubrum flagellatum]|uniref:hypothetical protein n=1 Tax=Terrirubrum flagellatum TaxID=2895980 RepID=UPI0031450643